MNPYESPRTDITAGRSDDLRDASFARRLSLVAAALGFVLTYTPITLLALVDIQDGSPTDILMGATLFSGVIVNVLGASVIFAAPKHRRRLGFWLNLAVLLSFGALLSIGAAME